MGSTKKEKQPGLIEIFHKVSSFCAYRERSQQEVLKKLYELGVSPDLANDVLTQLIDENFLNEERFTRSYAGGKFRLKNWGKNKIKFALTGKGISETEIEKALEDIDPEVYRTTLKKLLEKKYASLKDAEPYIKQQKIVRYGISKGYEPELVWEMVREIASENK
jgi:regulatory protein